MLNRTVAAISAHTQQDLLLCSKQWQINSFLFFAPDESTFGLWPGDDLYFRANLAPEGYLCLLAKHKAQHSLSLVVWLDNSLFSGSGSTSCSHDDDGKISLDFPMFLCLAINVLVKFFYCLNSKVSTLLISNQLTQTHNSTALPYLLSRQPSLFCCTPLESTLDSSTSLLLPRSMPTNFYLDRCRRSCC